MAMVQAVVDKVQLRLNLPEEKLPLLTDCSEQVLEAVKNYTHLKEVPDGLLYTCVGIVVSLFTLGASSGSGEVKSITEGDTTITYQSGSETTSGTLESMLYANRSSLNRYRQVVW